MSGFVRGQGGYFCCGAKISRTGASPLRKSAQLEALITKKASVIMGLLHFADSAQCPCNKAAKYMGKTIIKKISHCGKIGNKH
jgi:hypothetical protein